MKTLLAALALVSLAAVPAEAAQVRWLGSFVIAKSEGQCNDYDPTGDEGLARLRLPVRGSDNGPHSSLSLFFGTSAQSFRLNNRRWDNKARRVETVGVGDNFGGSDNPVTVKIQLTPPAPNATSTFVTGVAVIKGYDHMPKCTVTVNLSLTKRLR